MIPGELSQPFEVLDWRKGECDRSRENRTVDCPVERDYPATERFTSRPAAR